MYRRFENTAKGNTVHVFKALLEYCLAGPLRDGLILLVHKFWSQDFFILLKLVKILQSFQQYEYTYWYDPYQKWKLKKSKH